MTVESNGKKHTYQHVQRDVIDDDSEPATPGTTQSPESVQEHVQYSSRRNKWSSMKVLLPFRRTRNTKKSPLDTSGFFAVLMYSFLTPLFKKAFRGNLSENDVLKLQSHRESTDVNYKRLMRIWNEELETHGPQEASFNRAIFKFARTRIMLAAIILGVGTGMCYLGGAYLVYTIIVYLESTDTTLKHGMVLVVYLFLVMVFKVLFNNFNWFISIRAASRMRSAVLLAIYGKIVNVRGNADITSGEVVNLCVNDMVRMHDAVFHSTILGSMPILILLVIAGTVIVLGPSALVGAVSVIFLMFLLGITVRILARVRQDSVKVTDQRVQLTTEYLSCVKFIKMYAWEQAFSKRITDVRQTEESLILKSNFLQALLFCFAIILPITATLVSLVTHTLIGHNLSTAQAFTTLMLFNAFAAILFLIPMALKPLAEAVIVGKRLQKYILMEECTRQWGKPVDESHAVVLSNATICWELPNQQNIDEHATNTAASSSESDPELNAELLAKEKEFHRQMAVCLRDINLTIEKGKLVGICGNVGSGKTSILSAILDENHLLSGDIFADGTFAYVSQQAWITNTTVKENILFGGKYDDKKYESVLFACSLKQDLEQMDYGDETEIGERGINLSGGQKQRISLARALYSDRDIYLLDDPLSALDSNVGQHIFNNCLKGALADKTVLFVTHQLQYLRDCDQVVLVQQGRIAEQGTHQQLMCNDGDYARVINEFHNKNLEENKAKDSTLLSANSKENGTDKTATKISNDVDVYLNSKARLIEEESRGLGVVRWASYREFSRHAGGWGAIILMFIASSVGNFALIMTNAWIGLWLRLAALNAQPRYTYFNTTSGIVNVSPLPDNSTQSDVKYIQEPGIINLQDNLHFYVGVYIVILAAAVIVNFATCFVIVKVMLRVSKSMHDSIFKRVSRSPMSFFDTTPLGRVLNRFSKDLDVLDNELCFQFHITCCCFTGCAIGQVLMCAIVPWYIPAAPIFMGIVFFAYVFCRRGISDMRRMDSTSQSLMISHLTTSLQGSVTLAAFKQIPRFTKRFAQLLNNNTHFDMMHGMGSRWVAIRVDCLGTLVSLLVSSLLILAKDDIPVPLAALVLHYACTASLGPLQHLVNGVLDIESQFISIERILEYIKILSPEAPSQIESTSPSKDWPSEGSLTYENVQMKYRANLPLALKNVSFHVAPRERIGIIGRTGSGKSSLGVSLFRLVELDGGSIVIDDVRTSELGLHQLRSKISIIPQDPVLFIGTIRYNLDPLQEHDDIELWAALEKSHMKSKISDLDGHLDATIVENGDNFSVGERQLLCMARALLRNSKILLLDEATAAIDTETDSLIQTTIRQAFTESTMLIIAHRLHTVLDCNRILVMDNGEVAEYDEPKVLLENPSSKLSEMLKAMNQ